MRIIHFARPRWNALIFEHRSAIDIEVSEQRSTENQSITPGIVEMSTDNHLHPLRNPRHQFIRTRMIILRDFFNR
jgi:hypothetical protein